jgi:hypothetical protein
MHAFAAFIIRAFFILAAFYDTFIIFAYPARATIWHTRPALNTLAFIASFILAALVLACPTVIFISF